MYYEEKWIDGLLHCRGTPDGEWRMVPEIEMHKKLAESERLRSMATDNFDTAQRRIKHLERRRA